MGGSCSGEAARAGRKAAGQGSDGALYGDSHIPALDFSCCRPCKSASAREAGSAAVLRGLTALLPKGLPGRSRENKLLFATDGLKAMQLLGP